MGIKLRKLGVLIFFTALAACSQSGPTEPQMEVRFGKAVSDSLPEMAEPGAAADSATFVGGGSVGSGG